MPTHAVGSPEWWLGKLEAKLQNRSIEMGRMDNFYRGEHPLPFLTKAHNAKMRDEFSQLLADSRSNFMRLVVDATEERMRVEGFRLSASADEKTDAETWEIWQANGMDAEAQTAITESLVKGVSYLSIWQTEGDAHPTISVEDPTETIVGYEPGSNYRRRAAALKLWKDDWTGKRRANVYLPEGIYKFEAKDDQADKGVLAKAADALRGDSGWEPLRDQAFVANPLGIIPIVPLRNRPRVGCEGESELADITRMQSSINGIVFLLALGAYFGAHRQRWAVGLTLMEDDKGRPVEPFDIAVDKMIYHEDGDVKFGEFQQTQLDGYLKAIEQKVQHIAVVSRTPRHYLLPEGQEPSGDSIRSAEAGLVSKVERKFRTFGEGFEEALRIARRFDGASDTPVDSEIVWANPETQSEAVRADAVIKKFQAGLIPKAQALEDLGYTQTQIARMLAQGAADDLLSAALAAPEPSAEPEPPAA